MLPTNVMSFMKKMVTTQPDSTTADSVTPEDTGTTFSKLRQLMTVTGNVAKPTKIIPVEDIVPKEEIPIVEIPKPKQEPGRPASRSSACRVCLKSFKPDDFARTCYECQFKVCEDCASYSEAQDYEDTSTWRCSVCRRRIASRGQPIVTQESTDSLLEVPVLEALQRRHSDARLSCQAGGQTAGLGSALAPPRSPELRRHSDVSPASLKELEKFRKVAGERREELRWEKELERRSKSRGGSPERHQSDRGRASSPQRTAKTPSTEDTGDIGEDEDERRRRAARRSGTVRRKSRVTKQHSYDEESSGGCGNQSSHPETGLGLPVQLPRRASAYDVYATPGSGGLNAMAIAAAQQRASISNQGSREPEERSPGRRSSFRAVKPVMPYEMAGEEEKIINLDTTTGSEVSTGQGDEPREPRPNRRRASMLPDINMVRTLPSVPKATPPSVVRVAADDRDLPRQGSLADGEGIKIVIHDVDSDLAPRVNTKRRVVLRKDPLLMDKGHRTRGFGMRVLGGKSGTDGRLFASIVWTVPGGPAEKVGLQKGDKVLEWSGVSLIDRTFEDVAQIIEHTGDVAEIVVEPVSDIGDSLDDSGMPSTGGKNSGNLGLQLDTETDKTPTSPTRRKLPKTPEQIAKERQVTGRIQIQVWYEVDRKELVVSVLAGDELCTRDDNSPPEAFAKLVLMPSCGEKSALQTDVAEPAQNPIWNANLTFPGIAGEKLIERTIEVTLWDSQPDGENVFLGECVVNLESSIEADRAIWYRLEDPRGWRSGKSPYASPRGSVSAEVPMFAQRLLRRDLRERSYSDDTQTQSESGSPEPYFLHPDHAWQANSRRGSSQSEQLDVEPYELSKDYSRSLPGSRRSSFQSQGGGDSKRGSIGESETPPVYYSRDRRRSSVARTARNHEEVLRSLQKIAAKGELGRTMSLSNEKRRGSRREERKDSISRGERKDSMGQTMMGFPERLYDRNSESDEDDKWSQCHCNSHFPFHFSISTDKNVEQIGKNMNQSTKNENGVDLKLGPGQVAPRGFKLIGGMGNGEVKLALFLSKGTLEVEVISARDICPGEREEPDTYVKTYLRDGERWLHKRKTRVVRHSRNPQYRQTLKYGSCDALGRNLLVMLWEKKQGFESNQGLGGAEVDLELLPLTKLSVGWYPLYPIHTLGTQNADSP